MFQKLFLAALTTGAALSDLTAQSWFVRAGAQGGDGTMASPFGDPWQALDRCQAGDTIHVAEGKYFGRLGVGMWEIPFDGVQLLGGYAADFSERNPWAHPTQLLWDKASKNRPNQSRLLVKAKGAVVDGITIDMRDQNEYVDEQQSGRKQRQVEESAISFQHAGTVRNCVVVNAAQECVATPPGSTIENNLFLNAMIFAIKVNSGDPKAITRITDNTILFTWDNKSPGQGSFRGSAIHLGQVAHADIRGNILANNDNAAIYTNGALDRTSVVGNAFAMNLFANLLTGEGGTKAVVDDQTMELLEEVGLKALDGNQVVPHELPFDAAWLDLYSKRTASQRGKVVMDDWNKLRQLAGLPLIGTGYKEANGIAPAYPLDKALQLVLARKSTPSQGARVVPLPVSIRAAGPAAVAKNYERSEVQTWHRSPDAVNGKPLEMIVAISGAANVSGIPAGLKPDEHLGTKLFDIEGQGAFVTGFYRKGTSAERVVSQDSGWYHGSGKPTRMHRVRGTAYATAGVPKGGFVIDSIERYEPSAEDLAAAAAAKRPKGRDWFVRAGSTGGDGSKDKPFRDPFQALEKCQSGDTIHVAEGEYHGKLKVGRWRIELPYVALLGGYDANFTERAPWTHPTRLLCPTEFKGTRGGVTLEGDGDHTGTIVDGFVFDKRTNNNYDQDKNLVDQNTDHSIQLRLERPDCVVRNCIFVNGGEGGIQVGNGMVVENNLFMNHVGTAIAVRGGHTTAPFTLRNNTILFNWERAGRFGHGRGLGGEGIVVESQCRGSIQGNIVQFSDNNAIRFNADPKDVRLVDNVFAQNLWSIVYRVESIVDDATFGSLGDFGFAASSGNRLMIPGIPLDTAWFDLYLKRTAYVPGKVEMDDWNKLREILGEPTLATGGQAASCRAPAYDWQRCLTMVPKNPECTAGARPARMEATFTGIVREEVSHEYAETPWASARSVDTWAALDGKRIAIQVGVQRANNNFQLEDIKKEDYDCYAIIGPEGLDGGLPMNCYVKRGTNAERVLRTAKMAERGAPDQLYVLRGIARGRRTLVVEDAAKAD
jgi:hypothetical protein